jgi:hypothetical protein
VTAVDLPDIPSATTSWQLCRLAGHLFVVGGGAAVQHGEEDKAEGVSTRLSQMFAERTPKSLTSISCIGAVIQPARRFDTRAWFGD